MGTPAPPRLAYLLETALYVDDLLAAERFYAGVLGLEVGERVAGVLLFLRLDDAMLLLFEPGAARRNASIPAHGAHGPGHVCFAVAEDGLEPWALHLQAHGVAIEQRHRWPNGRRSLYFRDPAGNSLEFASPGLWNLPARRPQELG